jgi:hypothetical protein
MPWFGSMDCVHYIRQKETCTKMSVMIRSLPSGVQAPGGVVTQAMNASTKSDGTRGKETSDCDSHLFSLASRNLSGVLASGTQPAARTLGRSRDTERDRDLLEKKGCAVWNS